MQYEFLKHFPRRMRNVGLYYLLISNSSHKDLWTLLGYARPDEQLNMDFAVLLFIMEQSLKEENCTMDDIAAWIDSINAEYFRKPMSYEECHKLAVLIVNNILSNNGLEMSFDGYDFELKAWRSIHISYIANKIIYEAAGNPRTSYYLTENGYDLLLGTLEIEENMKLSVRDLIFRLQMDKQSYDKALDAIRDMFNEMRIQVQNVNEAMRNIRRNVLNYSVSDYRKLQEGSLSMINETRNKCQEYRVSVESRIKELEETSLDLKNLEEKDVENLHNLKEIDGYLTRIIDEHQKILNKYFDLKDLYTRELETMSEMSLVHRFDFRRDFYEKLLDKPEALENLDLFFLPLFNRDVNKSLVLSKLLDPQRTGLQEEEQGENEEIDFDEAAWEEEQQRLRKEKRLRYYGSLSMILKALAEQKEISISDLKMIAQKDHRQSELIPSINVFKQIMVELLSAQRIDIDALKKERRQYIQDENSDFHLQGMLLEITDEMNEWPEHAVIHILRIPGAKPVIFENATDEYGMVKAIRCSDVQIVLEV